MKGIRSNLLILIVFMGVIPSTFSSCFNTASSQPPLPADSGESNDSLKTGWYNTTSDSTHGLKRVLFRTNHAFYLNSKPIVISTDFDSVKLLKSRIDSSWFIMIRLKKNSYATWGSATKNAIGKSIAFVVNDNLLCVPTVMSSIPNGTSAMFQKDMSKQELDSVLSILKSEMK